jgi:hypothetical protein
LKKDCGEPGCRNDHRSQVLSRGDELNNGVTSAFRRRPMSPFDSQRTSALIRDGKTSGAE